MSWKRRLTVIGALVTLAALAGPIAEAHGGRGNPQRVFAPYFETYQPDNPAQLAAESGARDQVFAFLQTDAPGSCTVYWDGNASTPVTRSIYGHDIERIRDMGGDVWPSFGGYAADTSDTELADSCTSVSAIAAEYERVIETYDFTRLDMDIEGSSLGNQSGIDRRNQAIALVERWAVARHRPLQIVYTLPVAQSGPLGPEDNVLQSAVNNGARVDIVNALTFDYFSGTPQDMVSDTMTAAQGLVSELHALHPRVPTPRLWGMVGVTEMVGIDDFGPDETLSLDGARRVEGWAQDHHIALLSFWALQRDNGGCPGTKGAGTCSGIAQSTWAFSQIFERFGTGRR
jgi:hypothetical protein